MRTDTQNALARLREGGLTCVLMCGDKCCESKLRGVVPLLDWLDNGMSFRGFCAADKVVGAGAAYLYVLLGAAEVYAEVVSEAASAVLARYNVPLEYTQRVPYIQNRAKNGTCPIEAVVAFATDPTDALSRIRARLQELKKGGQ